jgi:hypothetical protein
MVTASLQMNGYSECSEKTSDPLKRFTNAGGLEYIGEERCLAS